MWEAAFFHPRNIIQFASKHDIGAAIHDGFFSTVEILIGLHCSEFGHSPLLWEAID